MRQIIKNIDFKMRKIFVIASLLMLFTIKLNAQNERVLLFECFTNTGCAPCASQNPALDALIANNADRVAAINYHMSWPSSNDPMYLHNMIDNNSRRNVYSVNSVPHTVVDGIRFSDMPSGLSQTMVNNWLSVESPIEMRLEYVVDAAANTITVHVMGKASTAVSGPVRLYVGVIEREIHYASAPGSNGERDFYSVMKKLLPKAAGTPLGENLEADDYFAYSFTWELANVYDINQLDAIAWVQNGSTKEVYQACHSSESFEPYFTNDAAVTNITHVKNMNCSGFVHPEVDLSNYGSAPLTSAEFEILVNGEGVATASWSGNLATYETTVVDLGEMSVPVEAQNTMEVRVASVNGTNDQAASNNVATASFLGASEIVGKTLKVVVKTDDNPGEITWRVTNVETGTVLQEGGPYDEANHKYEEVLEVAGDGCYDLTVFDAGGDGISGSGYYSLKAGSQTIFSGGDFADSDSNEFNYEAYSSVEALEDAGVGVYPNPSKGVVNVLTDGVQKITVFNMAGQRVFEGVCEGMLQLDLKPFGSGVYAIKAGAQVWSVVVE